MLDAYEKRAPDPRNAVGIFAGEWTSKLPPPWDGLTEGIAPLYDDPRVAMALDMMGGVAGRRVLELGPLEAGHSYMLDRAGAADVLGVEANTRAYLKCLVVKEIAGIPSARFVCGDFMEYLRGTPAPVDLVMASGVLYHMMAPVELIARVAGVAPTVYLWTHYYDHERLSSTPALAHRIVTPEASEYEGYRHVLYPFVYGAALERKEFCGGTRPEARWLTRDGILGALAHFGYTRIRPYYEQPDHPHGPAFSVLAER